MDWTDPEQVKQYYQDYYQTHKEQWSEYNEHRDPERKRQWDKTYRERHKEQIAAYGKSYRPKDNEWHKQRRKGPDGDYVRTYHKEWLRKNGTHARIVTALGGKCVRCSFDDIRALQIDHVNGGGRQEEKLFKNTYQRDKYILEHVDSGHYQVLCANCNWIKRDEENEHRWNMRE